MVLVMFGTTIVFFLEYLGEIASAGQANAIYYFRNIEVGCFYKMFCSLYPYVPNVIRNRSIEHKFKTFLKFRR